MEQVKEPANWHEPIEFQHDFYIEDRGEIGSYFNSNEFKNYYPHVTFVQDRFSKSYKGGVRGFHGDSSTWKYITCITGRMKLVTWDLRRKFQQSFWLEDGRNSVLIPPCFLNAHQALSDVIIFHYKQSEYYETIPDTLQYSVYYNDETINPGWSLEPRRVSNRDKSAPTLKQFYEDNNLDQQ